MKVHRLSTQEFRRYREGRLVLLNEAGDIVRPATDNECDRIQSGAQKGLKVTVRAPDGQKLVPVSERDIIIKEIFRTVGECQVLKPNGKVLKVLRDPEKVRPLAADAGQSAPDPERCICARWAGRKPGRHHKVCKYNEMAPPHQRGDVEPNREVMMEADVVEALSTSDVPLPEDRREPAYPPPAECVCVKDRWPLPEGADPLGHNPMCKHYPQWYEDQNGDFLWTMDGERVRIAEPKERLEAEQNFQAHGTRSVTISGDTYLVRPARPGEVDGKRSVVDSQSPPTTDHLPPTAEATA